MDLPEPDWNDPYLAFRKEMHEDDDRRRDTVADLSEHRPVRPDPKPAKRETRASSIRGHTVAWKLAVLDRDMGCCVHRNPIDCDNGWQAHHVVAQQELRRNRADLLWNPLSGMGVCGLAHRQHHNRARPITIDEIPLEVVAFFREAGYSWYLDRHYPQPEIEF